MREEKVIERERQTDRQNGGKRRGGGGGADFRQERCSIGGDAASGTALPRQNAPCVHDKSYQISHTNRDSVLRYTKNSMHSALQHFE